MESAKARRSNSRRFVRINAFWSPLDGRTGWICCLEGRVSQPQVFVRVGEHCHPFAMHELQWA